MILLYVSLTVLSRPLREAEKATTGGFAPKALKNENGDRLLIPSEEIVETNAIGLGATAANK
jgi:hypothetical protein